MREVTVLLAVEAVIFVLALLLFGWKFAVFIALLVIVYVCQPLILCWFEDVMHR